MSSISILICALNEEKNIGSLLLDILNQEFDDNFNKNFELVNITVVSDGSIDKTVEIVQSFQNKDKKINLIINKKRIGKIFSLGNVFASTETDYVILFDADIRIKKDTVNLLVKPLIKDKYDLISGNPIPIKTKSFFNIAEQATYFSWLIIQEIKKQNPSSIYSAHGRILLISKKLYKNLNINEFSVPGDDAFIYLMSKHNFYYEKNSIVFFYLPRSIKDYLKQSVRAKKGRLVQIKSFFGKEYIKKEYKIKNKLTIFIRAFLKNPYKGFLWFFLYSFGYIRFKLQIQNSTDINKIWGEVKSTK